MKTTMSLLPAPFQVIEDPQKVAPEHKDKKFFTFDAPADYASCDVKYLIDQLQAERRLLSGWRLCRGDDHTETRRHESRRRDRARSAVKKFLSSLTLWLATSKAPNR